MTEQLTDFLLDFGRPTTIWVAFAQTHPPDLAQTPAPDLAQTQTQPPYLAQAQTQPPDLAQTQPPDLAQTQTQPPDLAQTQPPDLAQTQTQPPVTVGVTAGVCSTLSDDGLCQKKVLSVRLGIQKIPCQP